MAYTDKDQLIADYIPEATKASEIAAIGRILDNVCAFADTYCKRSSGYFNPASDTPSINRVRGEGEHFLRLPVHVFGSIESVTLYDTVIDSNRYYESEK